MLGAHVPVRRVRGSRRDGRLMFIKLLTVIVAVGGRPKPGEVGDMCMRVTGAGEKFILHRSQVVRNNIRVNNVSKLLSIICGSEDHGQVVYIGLPAIICF